jgi:hypothetical protein
MKHEHDMDEESPGQAMFEDEDDYEYSSEGRLIRQAAVVATETRW